MKQSKKLFQKSWVLPQRGASLEETPVHNIQVNNDGVITYCADSVALTRPFNRWPAGGWRERSGSGFQRLDLVSFSSLLNVLQGMPINLVILEAPLTILLKANSRLVRGCGEAQTPCVSHEKMDFPPLCMFKLKWESSQCWQGKGERERNIPGLWTCWNYTGWASAGLFFLKKEMKKERKKKERRKEGRGKIKKKLNGFDRMWEREWPIIPWPFPFSLETLSCENLIIVLKMKFYKQGDLLHRMILNEEWYRMQSPSWSPSRLTERGCSRLLPG